MIFARKSKASGTSGVIINCLAVEEKPTGISRYTLQIIRAMARIPDIGQFVTLWWNPRYKNNAMYSDVFRAMNNRPHDSRGMLRYSPFELSLLKDYAILHEPNYIPYAFHGQKVVSVHDLSHVRYPQFHPRRRLLMMKAYQHRMTGAEHIITISEHTKSELMEAWKLPSERITVTLLAADEQFRTMELLVEEREMIRRKYRLPEQYLLYVGTLEPRKNIERLVEAFAMFCRENPGNDLQLVLAGGLGWLYQAMLQKIAELKLGDRIVMTGYVELEDLPLIYNMALAFIYPSLYEGFGLPPLEAMACGLPVIGSNTTSVPEVVGDAGLLVDPFDVEAIAAAIQRLADSSSLREELSQKALVRAAQFSWQRCAEETVAVYRKVQQS